MGGEVVTLAIGAGTLANLALLLKLVFQAGRVVERVEDHARRLESLEERMDGGRFHTAKA